MQVWLHFATDTKGCKFKCTRISPQCYSKYWHAGSETWKYYAVFQKWESWELPILLSLEDAPVENYGLPGKVLIFMICSLQNIGTDTENRELSMPVRAYCTCQAANPLAFDLEQL